MNLGKTFPHHLPILGRESGTQEVRINLGKKHGNCLIYYFHQMIKNSVLQGKYPSSYKNSTNNGLAKLDKNGKCIVKLDCPIPYTDTDFSKKSKQTYMSHIHMLVSDKKMTKWNTNLYTQNVLCNIDKKQLKTTIKNRNRLIITHYQKSIIKRILYQHLKIYIIKMLKK